MKRKKIFVLGGSGLLGSHCVEILKDENEIFATWRANPIIAEHSFKFSVNNARHDLACLFEIYRPDVVINTIGYVTVDGCEENVSLARSVNVDFVENIVSCLEKAHLSSTHLIHISSDSVYGDKPPGDLQRKPWSEIDETNPLSVYANSKLDSEKAALKHSGPVSVIRTAFYGLNESSNQTLLSWIIDNARQGNVIDGWENIYFSPISASSLVTYLSLMIKNKITGIYNIGSTDACNKYDFVEYVCRCLSLPVKIRRTNHQKVSGCAIRPEFSVLDCKKISDAVDWSCAWEQDLSTYLSKTVKHDYLKRECRV